MIEHIVITLTLMTIIIRVTEYAKDLKGRVLVFKSMHHVPSCIVRTLFARIQFWERVHRLTGRMANVSVEASGI